MNATNRTTLAHINARIPREPCNYTQAAKASVSYSNEQNYISMRVWGDKFKGGIMVKLNEATDSYDIEFFKVVNLAVKTVNEIKDIPNENLAECLWRETFIV